MVTTPDRRVRRTRRALLDALLALMADKPFDAITVADVIDRADVGRSTFYNHYTDKAGLLADGLAAFRAAVEQPACGPAAGRLLPHSLNVFSHVHAHQPLARALFAGPAGAPVLHQAQAVLADVVRADLPSDPHEMLAVPTEALVGFVTGAYLSLLRWWLDSDTGNTPQEVDRMFRALVVPGVRAAARPAVAPHAGAARTASGGTGAATARA
ncbi:TetR/AcrR family transcriptional regulator [Catellatospora bangladeshensis]|uniref:TetR family transcriptional regulator n=1 Tax=Catellatospora bangladeshensis TaxID=310355 RepID=A0A8J3NL40_9ACTN|nr:TetR/AcrR family transcriptional regulator [Catellatospora bangladeshensis]GIF82130.1 TetR family transcriptional regulator [Catellatospora bangladeshensis]